MPTVPILVRAFFIAAALTACLRAHAVQIKAGVARVDITPPIGGKTTGYSSAPRTDGVHDPLSARVLILKSSSANLALVSCDLCVANSPWLHEQVKALGFARLLFLNTHTHSGPDMDEHDFPSPDHPWRRTLEERVLTAIQSAQANLFPAFIAAAEGQITLGYNRLVPRGDFAETRFENPDRLPFGPVDPTVGVIRINDDQGNTRAVLVNYACHPVVLGPRNSRLSADYPGVMRDQVEASLGGNATCIFAQGAGGDINPLIMARGDNREHDFEHVQRMGHLLASEVLHALDAIKDQPGQSHTLAFASRTIKVAHRWNPDASITLGVTSILINNDIGIMTMPGEPFHAFALDFRARARLPHAFLFGYCCDDAYDWPDYLPDLVSAARGGYGASDTTNAEVGAGEQLVNAGLAQLYTLRGYLKSSPQRHVFNPQTK